MAAAPAPRVSALSRTVQRRSDMPPEALRARLASAVAPLEGGFTLVSKLSGGGIVTRTLRTPETELPLFGRVEADRIRIALVHRGVDISPFQPIVGVVIEASGRGSLVALHLAPHPNARTFAGAFALCAILLLLAAAVQFSAKPGIALAAALFALALGLFPHLRARRGFQMDADRAVAALDGLLALEPQA
ncbi:MAG: hypothetical protein VX265_17420 [Myxococcota bacterium]|nr:hypothetical protein [Myxococcota bacterium]